MRKFRVELLLIIAVALLIGQLLWPTAVHWWYRPSPGKIGVDRLEIAGWAPDCLVYLPPGYGTDSWPLVVFLHGAGENGSDPTLLRSHGPFAAVQGGLELPAILVGPQCLANQTWQNDAVMQFIQHIASTYRVERSRIYIIGYSMGAYATWDVAAAHPEVFAAIVPIAGGGELDKAAAFVRVPVWAFHGTRDDVVLIAESEQMVDAIREAGGQPKLTTIPDAGHYICEQVCNRTDMWNWLFQQHRGTGN